MNERIIQFTREAESWKRLLEFLQAENIYLKTRIAEIAGPAMDKELLAEAEKFQHRFLQEDELFALIRKEVAAFQALISRADESGSKILLSQKKLSGHMKELEQEFNKLKFEFYQYLAQKL